MARMNYGDLVVELVHTCMEIRLDLFSHLKYYSASAYKAESAEKIKEKVDHLRAIFQILNDEDLHEIMNDYDSVGLDHNLDCGQCSVTARVNLLTGNMEPVLQGLVRKYAQSRSALRPDTIDSLQRHKQTLSKVFKEGSRSRFMLRDL